jgi:hypothetical protein
VGFWRIFIRNLPANVPIISGIWEVDRRVLYCFDIDHTYWSCLKESGGGPSGKWEVSGSTLTVTVNYAGYEELTVPEIKRFTISVIDNNHIILFEGKEREIRLIRCTNIN